VVVALLVLGPLLAAKMLAVTGVSAALVALARWLLSLI